MTLIGDGQVTMKASSLYIVMLLLIVGCSAPRSQQPTTPTAAFTKTIPPTTKIPAISTSTSKPSPTVMEIQASIPSFTATRSQTPDVAATVMAIQEPTLYALYPSPDGLWRAEIVVYNCVKTFMTDEGGWIENAYEQLLLVNLASGEKRVADDQVQCSGGLGGLVNNTLAAL